MFWCGNAVALLPLLVACVLADYNEKALSNILGNGSDPFLAPLVSDKPVPIGVDVHVLNIRDIKEEQLTLTLDIFLHISWSDYRLNSSENSTLEDGATFPYTVKKYIWQPDVYFKNSVNGRTLNIMSPLIYFTFYGKTSVMLSARLSVDLLCEMDFTKYPHDTQHCEIDIMSLSNNDKYVDLRWQTFALTKRLFLSEYHISNTSETTCTRVYDKGRFTCVRGRFSLTRRSGYFIVQKYVPSLIIVCMSFVSFWIPTASHPARVALSLTSILTLILQSTQVAFMKVSYVMAINVWMLMCIFLVFLVLIELVFSILFIRMQRPQNKSDQPPSDTTMPAMEMRSSDSVRVYRVNGNVEKTKNTTWKGWLVSAGAILGPASEETNSRLDHVARVVFPLLLLACIVSYSTYVFA